jgi:AcrR family transcriptional regulator
MPKHRRLNRDLVIEKAAALADTAGDLSAVSLTVLAQALEIRPPSLYNHINNLEDLHQGLALFGLQQLTSDLRQASLGLVGREALAAIATAYRQFSHRHPGIYPLTIRAPEREGDELSRLAQDLLQMLLLLMASMGVQGDEAIHAIRGLRAILHGFVSLESIGGYKMPLDQEESFQRIIDTYLDGLV